MATTNDDTQAKNYLAQLEKKAKAEYSQQDALSALIKYANDAYRWGRTDRRSGGYQPSNYSGDGAVYGSQDMMHRRTRDQVRNDAVMKGIVRTLTDRVVGTGLRTYADPVEMEIFSSDVSKLDDQLEQALEMDSVFERYYLDERQFDVSEKLAGPDMERGGFREQVTVGDTLILRVMMKRPNSPIPLRYQLLEREQLDNSKDRAGGPNTNRIVNGIELDAYDREVAFHVFDAHPGDSFQPFQAFGKSTRIPAERVIHANAFTRPSQSIGVTWLDAIGQDTFDEDKLVTTELQTAAKASLLLLTMKCNKPNSRRLGLFDGEDDFDEYGNESVALGSSPLAAQIGKEEELDILECNRPNLDIPAWLDHMARRKGMGVGLSYYSITGNFSQTNYTGFRGAMQDEDAALHPLQNWYGRKVPLRIRREFNAIAAALGQYKRITPRDFLANEMRYQNFDMISPGRQYLEPEPETNASMANLRSGLSNLKIECAKRGLHWIKVLRQAALENRVIELLKLTLDFSKGQGGQVTDTTRAKRDEAPAKNTKKTST